MKNLVVLSLLALILFSCKKEHSASVTPTGKKYAVKFNVSNFAQQKGAFSIGQKGKLSVNGLIDPKDYLDVLYYVVYDTDGRFSVSHIAQDSTMSDMGTITDSLPNGTYPVYIFAGKKGLVPGSQYDFLSSATYSYQGIGPYNWLDTFWAGFSFTVNNGSVTKDVTLARTVAKLELQITDNIPANANSIRMAIYPEFSNQEVAFGSGSPLYAMDSTFVSVTIPSSAKGHPNFTIDKLTGGTALLNVVITCKDASDHVIATATANNVECDANKKTILSGNLFGGIPAGNSQSFHVKIDTAWSSTTNTIHF